MKLKSLPKDLFVEILDYLADYESLAGLDHLLEGEHTITDVRSALRELSLNFRKEIEEEKSQVSAPDYRKDSRLSSHVKDLLSALSPGDERKLLHKFGFLDL